MEFSAKIKELRKSKGLTQQELGQRLCLDYSVISKWERGLNKPTTETIEKLANVFGVPVNFFFDEVDLPHNILSADEEELVENYRDCTQEQKEIIRNIIKSYIK